MAVLPTELRTQAIVAGILGHGPSADAPAPVPAAVQRRFDDLVAQQSAASSQSVTTLPESSDATTPALPTTAFDTELDLPAP
jgi:hypothetical protein